jgi:hypothetical protein
VFVNNEATLIINILENIISTIDQDKSGR